MNLPNAGSMTLPNIIAVTAIISCLAAALGNAVVLWRYRPYGTMAAMAGGAIIWSIWTIIGFVFLLLGLFPDASPPINVIMLRPGTAAAAILFAVNAAAWVTAIRKYNHHEDMKEAAHEVQKWRQDRQETIYQLKNAQSLADTHRALSEYQLQEIIKLKSEIGQLKVRETKLQRELVECQQRGSEQQ